LYSEERWGAGVVKQFALDMRQAFPDEMGFSDTNVKYMKRWYLFYYERVIKGQRPVGQMSHRVGGQLPKTNRQRVVDEIRQQAADQLEMPEIFGRIL